MKLKILKDKLLEGLEIISRISSKKISLPILENTLFETEKNFLKLSKTNLESGIVWWGLAKIEKEGKVCVNGKLLSNVILGIQEPTINLEKEGLDLKLENKDFSVKLKGANPEEFPIIPTKDKYEKIAVSSEKLCQGLSKIIQIPSLSLGRPEISGIYFSFEKDILKLVATDSFRLAEKKLQIKNPLNKTYSLILPQNAAKEIVGIFGKKEGEVEIFLSPNQIFIEHQMSEFSHPEILFTSRLIEGEYPNYQEIIPQKFKTKAFLDRASFLNQIKTASLFSGRINEVKLKFDPKRKIIEIFSQNPDFGEYKSQIIGEIEGEEILISFNFRFLLDGISSIESKKIGFFLSDVEGPAILKPIEVEDYFYILMPIKTS